MNRFQKAVAGIMGWTIDLMLFAVGLTLFWDYGRPVSINPIVWNPLCVIYTLAFLLGVRSLRVHRCYGFGSLIRWFERRQQSKREQQVFEQTLAERATRTNIEAVEASKVAGPRPPQCRGCGGVTEHPGELCNQCLIPDRRTAAEEKAALDAEIIERGRRLNEDTVPEEELTPAPQGVMGSR